MVRLPEGIERGVLIDFILVAYLIAFILVMLGWLLSAIPEQMESSLFWTIIASAFGALFALSVLFAQMLRSWKDKTTIMNKMEKNHSEIMGVLCKMNSTMLIIKNILEAGAPVGRGSRSRRTRSLTSHHVPQFNEDQSDLEKSMVGCFGPANSCTSIRHVANLTLAQYPHILQVQMPRFQPMPCFCNLATSKGHS